MRKPLRKVALGTLLGVGGGVLASGFPGRVGLTKAQALVSMPGDLILATANASADRVATFEASREVIWPFVEDLLSEYADLWDVPLQVVYREDGELVAVVTDFLSIDQDPNEAYFQGSVAVRLTAPSDQSCSVHVRERYLSSGTRPAVAVRVAMSKSALTFKRWAGRVRRELRGL